MILFDHVRKPEMDFLYFPGNMLDLIQKSNLTSVNNFPMPESEIYKAYGYHKQILKTLLKTYLSV